MATSGSDVTVHYTGWLYDEKAPDKHGMKFDSSVDRGQPFTFLLGAGQVIRGWDEGVAGMKVGGKRTLVIPASLVVGAAFIVLETTRDNETARALYRDAGWREDATQWYSKHL